MSGLWAWIRALKPIPFLQEPNHIKDGYKNHSHMEEDIKKKKGTWKVLNVDMRVSARLALAPQQQRIFGRFLLRAFIFFVLHFRFVNRKTVNDRGETDSLVVHLNYHFDFNLLDLKPQNDGPHETENKSRISIDDIFSADTFKANLYWKENMALFKNHYSRSFWQQDNKNYRGINKLWYGERPSFCWRFRSCGLASCHCWVWPASRPR